MTLLTLTRGTHGGLQIRPRWPAKQVRVNALALKRLQTIQAKLPAEIGLILTRGYEPQASSLGFTRKQFRALGIGMFRLLYRGRRNEIADIFGSNGHDVDGTHIDVSFRQNGRRVRMLPLGVFTPLVWQQHARQRFTSVLPQIHAALIQEGFLIHSNATESLQIHCDLIL